MVIDRQNCKLKHSYTVILLKWLLTVLKTLKYSYFTIMVNNCENQRLNTFISTVC